MSKRRRSWDRLILNMGIHIPVRRYLYVETPCTHNIYLLYFLCDDFCTMWRVLSKNEHSEILKPFTDDTYKRWLQSSNHAIIRSCSLYVIFQISAGTMLTTALGQMSYNDVLDGQKDWFSQLMFGVYVLIMASLLINMFIALVMDTYEEITGDETKYTYDKELVDHIWNKFINFWNKTTSIGWYNIISVPLKMPNCVGMNWESTMCSTHWFNSGMVVISKIYYHYSDFTDLLGKVTCPAWS